MQPMLQELAVLTMYIGIFNLKFIQMELLPEIHSERKYKKYI